MGLLFLKGLFQVSGLLDVHMCESYVVVQYLWPMCELLFNMLCRQVLAVVVQCCRHSSVCNSQSRDTGKTAS